MSQPEQVQLAIDILQSGYRLRQIAYGTLALLTFDIVLNLNAEVVYVWRRPWSLFKTLYFICRYVPFAIPCLIIAPPLNTPDYCAGFIWYILLGTTMLCVFPSDCLFALRLDKLYTSTLVRKVLLVTLACEAIAHIVLVVLNAVNAQVMVIDAGDLSHFKICIWTKAFISSKLIQLSPGIPSVIIGVLYFWFAVAAFYRHFCLKQSLNKHRLLRESGAFAPLLMVLVRDGVIYYLIDFTIVIAGLTLYGVYGQSILTFVSPLFIAATSSIVTSRFVFTLKGDSNYATGIYHFGNELRIVSQDGRDSSIPDVEE